MTPKTGFHKIEHNKTTIIFRDLTVLELSYLGNVKNEVMRNDMAAKVCIIDPTDLANIAWPILQKVGQSAIDHSSKWVADSQLFEILVKESRKEVLEGSGPLTMIRRIVEVFPGQSITELLKMTWKDLVALACLAEQISGKKIFNVAGGPTPHRKGSSLANNRAFEEDGGQSLQEKMNALNSALGGIPK